VVGDALGVPVEFVDRAALRRDPVVDLREYGSYLQPRGTWSDDSSLLLCTAESLLHGFDTGDLGACFVRWRAAELWTPWGEVFDVGVTTDRAIQRLAAGVAPEEAGGAEEASCGNGSLMRILPVALHAAERVPAVTLLDLAHRASALTHRHPRAQIACGLYCLLAAGLLAGWALAEAYAQVCAFGEAFYRSNARYAAELTHFARFFDQRLAARAEQDVQSGGYVLHTLEASLWCLLQSRTYEETVLRAVNLGGDTDTTATVAGGLAGLHWGQAAVPARWRDALARHDDLAELFERFVAACGH
jgi:ADP-ribosylglycohydrolase